MKYRIGCAVQNCKNHCSWPLGWLYIPDYDVYICPNCEKKYCDSYKGFAVILDDIPFKEGVKLEESS